MTQEGQPTQPGHLQVANDDIGRWGIGFQSIEGVQSVRRLEDGFGTTVLQHLHGHFALEDTILEHKGRNVGVRFWPKDSLSDLERRPI